MTDSAHQPTGPADDGVVIDDPRAIRALAHPARLVILDFLSGGEPATATECARVCGLSPSATSYHLRALAKWRLVREAESRGDARERLWQATGGGFSTRAGFGAPGGVGAAQQVMLRYAQSSADQRMERWLTTAPQEPTAWQEAAHVSSSRILVTAEELEQLSVRVTELLRPYKRSNRPGSAPAGSRTVLVNLRMFPVVGEDRDPD
ncbi:MAG: hypothetical protein QOC93_1874 [Actinomycetota bacterium]|jgi:DNA-binding transcriptional ArsR family regulator|nr:transcriptional regulator ArsR family [Cryptosporangiaceae bacterium]MDQ1676730.1 hypothetical protein [Actinomycetota bacterium]